MVKSATSLTRSGLRDWVLQRISALIIASYVIFLFGFVLVHPHLAYEEWIDLFAHNVFRVMTLLVLIALLVHTYIGLWTISTDYLKNTAIRLAFQVGVYIALFAFIIWGIIILWGL